MKRFNKFWFGLPIIRLPVWKGVISRFKSRGKWNYQENVLPVTEILVTTRATADWIHIIFIGNEDACIGWKKWLQMHVGILFNITFREQSLRTIYCLWCQFTYCKKYCSSEVGYRCLAIWGLNWNETYVCVSVIVLSKENIC